MTKLGDILVGEGLIQEADVARALAFQDEFGGRFGSALMRLGALAEPALLSALSKQLDLPVVAAEDPAPDGPALVECMRESGVRPDWWIDMQAAPLPLADGGVRVAAKDPLSPEIAETVARAFGDRAHFALIPAQILDRFLDAAAETLRRERSNAGDEVRALRELAEDAPVVELVNNILSQAYQSDASDIHVEPDKNHFAIRTRVDGVLATILTLPRERFDAVASRIKLIAGMDIAERRLPQDGRFSKRIGGQDFDVRASALPGTWGESLVLRLLRKNEGLIDLARLGMAEDDKDLIHGLVDQPNGIVLITGPTGSGKSTTLYAALKRLNDGKRKIVTVEDPVEYDMDGIHQVQVKADIGLTFARALRSILRQDPEVILIGEIRDLETAKIAVEAALTGHLVLSTLHTNDALSAFTRLIDMGLERFLVAAAVRGVVAQRLVRRVTEETATADAAAAAFERELCGVRGHDAGAPPRWLKPDAEQVRAAGDPRGGYHGRLAIFETAPMTPALADAVARGETESRLKEIARREGLRTLREDGLLKARAGLTSAEEVVRITDIQVRDDPDRPSEAA